MRLDQVDLNHIDIKTLLEKFGGEEMLVKELIAIAKKEFFTQLEELNACTKEEDPEEIRKRAHAMKSGLGNLEARPAYRLAMAVEQAAKAGDLEQARSQMGLLNLEMKELHLELRKFTQEN